MPWLILVYNGPAAEQIKLGLNIIVGNGGSQVGGNCVGKRL